MKEKIQEIQDNFEESLDTWAKILIDFEIGIEKYKITPTKYSDDAVMDATILFRHVLFNVGFHKKTMHMENVENFGNELRDIILKYTNIDSRTFYDDKNNNNPLHGFSPN